MSNSATTHRVKVSFLRPGQARSVRLDGQSILLCNDNGTIFAVQEMCTHRALSMARGRIKDGTIMCPHHGACFSLRDGSVQYGSGKGPLRTFPVKLSGGFAEITVTPAAPEAPATPAGEVDG